MIALYYAGQVLFWTLVAIFVVIMFVIVMAVLFVKFLIGGLDEAEQTLNRMDDLLKIPEDYEE